MQEGPEPDPLQPLPASLNGGEEAHQQQSEAPAVDIKAAAELSQEEVLEETQSQRVEKTREGDRIVEEGEKEGVSGPPTEDPDLASSTNEKTSSQSTSLAADQTPSSKPDLLNCIQKVPPAPKASQLTKHDKRIIEKIRSYYEAAAKAEEDEAEEEDSELEDGGESRRRNSFSHIPSGLVKESVSRFDDFGHQGEPESQPIQSEFNKADDRNEDPTVCPVVSPSEGLADPADSGEAGETKCSQSSDAESELSTASKVMDTPSAVSLIPNSPTRAEEEVKESHSEVHGESAEGVLEVHQKQQTAPGQEDGPCLAKENISSEETRATGKRDQTSLNEHECKRSSSTEAHRSTKELPKVAHEEPCSKSSTKYQSSWVRKKPRDLTKVSRNVDGQWSYHSRIVASNRALFEAMGSDVASIGLFEATPEVDPVLIENSERILSKVQTLAQMFGARAGTMKVPLHQKRGTSTQSPVWDTARLSGNSLHAHNKNKTRVQTQSRQHNGKGPKESDNEINQNSVYSQSQEGGKVQEQRTFTQPSGKPLKLESPSFVLARKYLQV